MTPLLFEPFLRPMVWGGRRLGTVLHRPLLDSQSYGESWEVSDHASHRSRVAQGRFHGHTLRDLMEQRPRELLGSAAGVYATFPWLIKFLDCHDWLSVQVHPDEDAVRRLWPGEGSKTEAWFVLAADPGSRIYAGLREGVDERTVRQALAQGQVADCLHQFVPRPGDCVFLPAGTVHAVGGGVLMAEVQQTSDATFRLYDWDRRDAKGQKRQLHIEEALASIHWKQGPVQPMSVADFAGGTSRDLRMPLVECRYFRMEYVEQNRSFTVGGQRLQAVIVVKGEGWLRTAETEERLMPGHVWVLPAACSTVQVAPAAALGILVCSLP
jgi:mannose-6-phosphate isomerase